jgi:hypothetical protein
MLCACGYVRTMLANWTSMQAHWTRKAAERDRRIHPSRGHRKHRAPCAPLPANSRTRGRFWRAHRVHRCSHAQAGRIPTTAWSVKLTQRVRSNDVSAVQDWAMTSPPGSLRNLQPETLSVCSPVLDLCVRECVSARKARAAGMQTG